MVIRIPSLFIPPNCLKYLTAFVPLAPVAHIPHMEASGDVFCRHQGDDDCQQPAPGSTGNQRPEPRRAALSPSRVTPGWTAAVKSSGQRPTKSLIPVTTSKKDIIEMNDSHQCDATLNGHNPSFQAGGTPNRHHWHSGIVAQSADGRNLSHLSIEASMFPLGAPAPWSLARPQPVEVSLCAARHPGRAGRKH